MAALPRGGTPNVALSGRQSPNVEVQPDAGQPITRTDIEHLSPGWMHPSNDTGPLKYFDEHDMWVTIMGFADMSGCDRGAFVVDSFVAEGGTRQDINGVPAAISADGTVVEIVSDTGVVVEAVVSTPEALPTFAPALNALAAAAAKVGI